MIFNIFVALIIIFLGLYYSNIEKRNARKKYIIRISVLLILQSGLRNLAVGADTYQYYRNFSRVTFTPWNEVLRKIILYYNFGVGKDPGYEVLEKIVQFFTLNFHIFLMLVAVFFFYALGNFIYKNTISISQIMIAYILYSALFFSFFSITGIRQTIATSLLLLSFEYIKKNKQLNFLLLVLLASTIHKSALAFLPFYYINKLNFPRFIAVFTLLIFPVLMFYKNDTILFLKELGGYDQYEIYENAGTLTFTIMYFVIYILSIFRMNFLINKIPKTKYFYNALSLGLFFLPLTWVNPSAMRIVQYFSILLLVLIPFVIDSFYYYTKNIRYFLYFFSVILLLALSVKTNYRIEYKFLWQEMKLGKNYEYREIIQYGRE